MKDAMAAPDPELLAAIEEIVDRKLDEKLDAKFEEKLAPLHDKIDGNTRRIDFLSEQMVRLGTAVADNRRAIGRVEDWLDRMDSRVDNFILGPVGQMLRAHDVRIGRVEHLVGLPPYPTHD